MSRVARAPQQTNGLTAGLSLAAEKGEIFSSEGAGQSAPAPVPKRGSSIVK